MSNCFKKYKIFIHVYLKLCCTVFHFNQLSVEQQSEAILPLERFFKILVALIQGIEILVTDELKIEGTKQKRKRDVREETRLKVVPRNAESKRFSCNNGRLVRKVTRSQVQMFWRGKTRRID
jgi:hypothetical protein